MVVGFLREAAWQSTPKRSKTIAAQRLSSTIWNHLAETNPAITGRCYAGSKLRRFVDRNCSAAAGA